MAARFESSARAKSANLLLHRLLQTLTASTKILHVLHCYEYLLGSESGFIIGLHDSHDCSRSLSDVVDNVRLCSARQPA
jgi:hypothetical protein